MRVEQNKNNSNYIKVFVLEKNFLKVNLSSIMFVLILVSSEKQPLMRVEQNKNNSNYIKVFVLEKNFYGRFFSDFETLAFITGKFT